jgi:hypothetical protein
MTPPASHDGDARYDLDRFLDDLRRTGTGIADAPEPRPEDDSDDDWHDDPVPVVWSVSAHRGRQLDPPFRLVLEPQEFAFALHRAAELIEQWWPGGESERRAYEGLLVSFDAAMVGIDRPRGFLLQEDGRLLLSANPICPDPISHLDLERGDYTWSAYEPGTPEAEEERAQHARQSRHRRHSYLVLGYLEVEAASETGQRMDAAMGYLQDALGDAFGNEVFQRFSAYVDENGSRSTMELSEIMHAEDERFDAFLDALAGEPRDG